MTQFLWGAFPYLALSVMGVGTLYRLVLRPVTWSAKSSEWLEKRWLRWGSLLFHWGLLFVIGGHVMGLLIPMAWYQAAGIPTEVYHLVADMIGGLAGLVTWLGSLILLVRRVGNRRVRANSSFADFLALGLLFVTITLGDMETIGYNNIVGPYEYRATVGPWARELLTLHVNPNLMVHVPIILQIHILFAFLVFAVSPFTRLVHVWSFPVRYPWRAPMQYRSRTRYLERRAARREDVPVTGTPETRRGD
ncbi:respiratory nitrate reductase subunit gamma [Alicyclobacillaceae bacterium I2511]|nr:respiratory nitrate reductase subunit gamma [Alicyclobacillaceae bacterium I2511]